MVNYIADHDGYRAWVKTNEPGTADSAPAGAKIEKTGEAPVKVAPILSAVKAVAASPVAAYVPAPAPILHKVAQPVSYAPASEPILVSPRISAPIISAPRARAFAHHALAYPEFGSKVCSEVRRTVDCTEFEMTMVNMKTPLT